MQTSFEGNRLSFLVVHEVAARCQEPFRTRHEIAEGQEAQKLEQRIDSGNAAFRVINRAAYSGRKQLDQIPDEIDFATALDGGQFDVDTGQS